MTTLPDIQSIYRAIDTTWPARKMYQKQGWCIRDGAGAGKRASAATWDGGAVADIAVAEREMQALGQPRLFMIRDGEDWLDVKLEDLGYHMIDPVTTYAAPIGNLPLISSGICDAQAIWPPSKTCTDIWQHGGIDRHRVALMQRVNTPKSVITANRNGETIGTSFLALDGPIAMVHAVEVTPQHRRMGAAQAIMGMSANWAAQNGANYMTLLATVENVGANALYTGLGMVPVGRYHYRIK